MVVRRLQDPVLLQVQLLVQARRLVMRAIPRSIRVGALLVGAAVLIVSSPSLRAQAPADIQKAVDAAYAKYQNLQEGKNADYIPALAKVDPKLFGIAVLTADGRVFSVGDDSQAFSIQSISKPFTAAQVIQEQGLQSIE